MLAGALPYDDPQFWAVSALVAAVAGLAVRRVARSLREESGSPCASCPRLQPGAAEGAAQRSRLKVIAFAAAVVLPAGIPAETVERRVSVMGTTLHVAAEAADRGPALVVAETAILEIEATERRLSTWRQDSEISGLNRAPVGDWVGLSARAFEGLSGALACYDLGEGAFDPTVAPLVRAWGLRSGGRVPSEEERRQALAALGGDALDLDAGRRRVRKRSPVEIEEGGFGKGAALDAALDAVEVLTHETGRGHLLLDLGGQLAWLEARAPLVVDLADPRRRSRPVLELTVDRARGSLASSGSGGRRFAGEAATRSHLLDPRTGMPAPDFGSVALVAAGGLEADCLSTALFVMGPDEGARWLAAQGERYDAVFLLVEGARLRARVTPGLARRVRPLIEGIEIEVMKNHS
jgi:thiamine biosynthesis lipoprotein